MVSADVRNPTTSSVSKCLVPRSAASDEIDREERKSEKPSDYAPMVASFDG